MEYSIDEDGNIKPLVNGLLFGRLPEDDSYRVGFKKVARLAVMGVEGVRKEVGYRYFL